jgi:peptidase inhibitor I78 family protein
MKSLIAALALLCLPGCATTTRIGPGPKPDAGTCNAAAARALAGRPATEELVAEALALTGARQARVIHPGMMVTMDYSADRLNVHVGPDGRVERLACG